MHLYYTDFPTEGDNNITIQGYFLQNVSEDIYIDFFSLFL